MIKAGRKANKTVIFLNMIYNKNVQKSYYIQFPAKVFVFSRSAWTFWQLCFLLFHGEKGEKNVRSEHAVIWPDFTVLWKIIISSSSACLLSVDRVRDHRKNPPKTSTGGPGAQYYVFSGTSTAAEESWWVPLNIARGIFFTSLVCVTQTYLWNSIFFFPLIKLKKDFYSLCSSLGGTDLFRAQGSLKTCWHGDQTFNCQVWCCQQWKGRIYQNRRWRFSCYAF